MLKFLQRTINNLRGYCRLYFLEVLQYRAWLIIYMLAGTAPLVMMFIWINLVETGALGGGYTADQFIAYFLLIFLVRQLMPIWFPIIMDIDILHGELSFKMLRPASPIQTYIAIQISDHTLRLIVILPCVTLGLIFSGAYSVIDVKYIGWGLLSISLSMVIAFCLNMALGSLTFWMDKARSFSNLYRVSLMMLGGALIPVSLFPENIAAIVTKLPFVYLLGFPVDVMLGNLDQEAIYHGLMMQVFWLSIYALVAAILWRKGIKGFVAAGA